MKTLIKRIKRLALALCFVTPLVSWAAVDYTGTDYEPWSYSAGCVVWRAANNQAFHASTVADVAADGTIGSTYDLNTTGHPWNVFASTVNGQANANYTSPGLTLIFDKDGYNNNSDAQFAPLSLGGMWVKALQAENTPYCIKDSKTDGTDRKVELGAANASTYFKFDKSFTIDRNSATEVKGTATVEIADGATFTINNRASKGAKVDSGNTLVLKGDTTGTLKVVAGLTVGGTLDLSAATRPAIDGDVTLSAGSTIVLPAGTDVSETPFTVCSGTLSSGGVIYVKVGTADAEKSVVSTSNGAITALSTTVTYTATIDGDTAFSAIEWTSGGEAATIQSMDIAVLEISGTGVVTGLTEAPAKVTLASGVTLDVTELSAEAVAGIEKSTAGTYRWTSGYTTIVPAGQTYMFVGGDSAENTVVVDALDVRGTLKTQGYFSFTNYKSNGSTLDVETGSLTLDPGDNWFNGTLTVEAGATFVNALESDAVQYNGTFTANIYGTLDMGATRWSLGSNNTLNFHEGCTVTGSGQSSNGTFDWIEGATATLNVDGDVTLAAPIRIRSTATVNVNVDTTEQKGLTLAGTLGDGKIVKKGTGLVKFTTNPPYAITVERGAFTFAVDATPTITYSAKPGAGTSMSMWYAKQATWKGTVVIGALAAPAALPLDTYGNANSKIVLTGTTGNCYLNGTTTVAAELVVGTNANNVVEFNNGNSNQVGTFSKVSGPGTLRLKAWTGCQAATYVLNTLNNFEGLAVANNITRNGGGTFTIRIGDIVTTRTTNPGDCVLPIVNTAVDNTTGTVVYDLANAQVNGNTLDLEVKSDGIYVVVPVTTVDITIPEVDNATVSVTADGEAVTPVNGVVTVDIGAAVVVTYTAAAEGYTIANGTIEFAAAADTTTVDTSNVTVSEYIAWIYDENGDLVGDPYTTEFAAVQAFLANNIGNSIRFKTSIESSEEGSFHQMLISVCSYDSETLTYTRLPVVANVTSGQFTVGYTSLASAVANVLDGSVVTLLADVDVSDKGVTFPADTTLTLDLNNCTITAANTATGHIQVNGVLTITDSSEGAAGKIVSGTSGTYGVVQVAEKDVTGASLTIAGGAIEAYFEDETDSDGQHPAYGVVVKGTGTTFTMTGGSIKAGYMALMGHGSKASAGTYNISGGTITSMSDFAAYFPTKGDCAVTISGGTFSGLGGVSARAGTVTITGGVFTASGAGTAPGSSPGTTGLGFMALAVTPNYGNVTVSVSGGTFTSATDVAAVMATTSTYTGTISLTGGTYSTDVSDYCATGYAATETSTGVWTVAKVQEVPVTPGSQTEPVDTQAEAQADAAKVVPSVPTAVAAALSDDQETAYKALFEAKVVTVTVGETTKYAVEVALTTAAETALQTAVDAEAEDLATAAVAAAADATNGGEATVTTTPGLYYVVEAGTEPDGIVPASCKLATSESTKLTIPNKGTKGFYKIRVSVTPVDVQ